ncbi:glycosyltransferase family 4 protein [Bacteroides fluxus]|uniref:glycosyltransferase family 4 protein n=1 Tax=Bacteroides fluxus TaxID=626930 RepID=UPI0023A8F483|nr:glycosyltransferase family 4 protein [Bacteroides fluxus]
MNNLLHVVNISFVIPYFLGKQLIYFAEKGYKEYIVCSPSEELDDLALKYNFEYKAVVVSRKISIGKDLMAVKSTMEYIKEKQIDIITGHTPKGGLIAMLAGYFARVPKRIYFRHGLVYETSRGLKRKLLVTIDKLAARLATKVVCVSPSVYYKSLEDGLNPVTKQVLLSKGTCNGIDIHRFCRKSIDEDFLGDLRAQLHLFDDAFVIGFTGRLVRDKGIVELIRAFHLLQEKYSNMILLLVGMLEERDALPQDVVEVIKSNRKIINTGYVSNATIEYYYALMNCFILPSYREGFPTSVLEASAMELPVITTKVTGCIDSIVVGETGVYAELDVEKLAESIEMLYRNDVLCHKYGQNGRKFVVDNFEQRIIWREIEKLYLKSTD